jgi:hypothetical protein
MLSLDLFDSKYERELREGAVDNLEARRIDNLNMRMLELLDRAKEPAYKKNPAALAGLKRQFQKIKAERDSYFKINPATGMDPTGSLGTTKGHLDVEETGIPGNVPTEKIPGKEDLLKGKGRSYYEGTEENDDWYDANGRPNPHGAYDASGNYYADREDQDAGYDAYKERNLTSEATGDNKFDTMMNRISKDPWTQLNSDPNWQYEIEELVDQHIEPWLLTMERSGMPITRDNETLNPGWRKRYEQISTQLAQKYLASKKFNPRDPDLVGKIRAAIDNHTDQSRNVAGQLSAYADDLPMHRYADAFDADGMTANIRDAMAGLRPGDDVDDDGYAPRPRPAANPRRLDPGNMEEGNFVVANKPESPEEKEKRNADGQARTTEIARDHARSQKRDILQSYAKLGRMRTEAVWALENDVYMNKDQILDYIEKKSQDPSLSALEYMHDLGHDVDGLFKNVTRFLTGAGINPAKIQAVQNKITQRMGEINERRLAEDVVDSKTWMKQTRTKYPTAKFMQAKMPGAPIRAYVNGKVVAEFNTDQKKNSESVDEHGGGIGPRQHWQDLMQETVTDVKQLWADVYRRLAPKIERHRDSFLAGQLYDELENIAELHGAEGEFKRMMNGARNRAHMEYDTNPGGFHNWFWFLPFADEQVEEGFEYASKVQHPKYGSGQVVKVYSNGMITVNFPNFPDPIDKKPGVQTNFMPGDAGYNSLKSGMTESTDDIKKRMSKLEALALAANRAGDDAKCKMYQQKIQSLKQKLSQVMNEFDASGYDRYSIYMDDYDLKEKFADIDDAIEAIEAYKRDDPKSRYADYNVRDLDGKIVWRNDAWQDAQKPGKIQFLPSNPQRLDPGNIEEGLNPGEYHIHTVYFKDGTKKRIRVTSDEFDATDYYTKRGKAVDHVDYDFQIHSDMTEGLKSTLAGAALAGAMALGGAGAAQAQSASGGPNLVNATTIIQQIQSGKIQNQNDLASALGNASNKQAVFKQLQAKAGLPGHGADSVINALGGKNVAGAQQPAAGIQQPAKSTGQSGLIVQRPTDNFEGRIKEEEELLEGIRDTASATAVIACLLTGGSLSGCATTPQQTSAQQVLKTGQDLGRTVQTAQRITRAGVEADVNQEIRNLLRGINRPEELNNSNIIRIWKRIKGQPPVQTEPQAPEYGPAEPVRRPATEAKEIISKEDFVRERDRLLRMIGQETNPANKQILKSAIRQLENRAENEGWITMQTRMVREDSDSGEAVEMAILKRIMVAHTDLLQQYGPQKVMQAAEEVAYNVGDVDEIGTSDVSAYVAQVKQILGADA